jgi:predicted dehydrogenase
LIGCSNHWRSYAAALPALPDLEVAAVAAAAPDERLGQFDGAPGVTDATRRCESPLALLADGAVDAVQVSTRFDLAGRWIVAALERGLPVMAEKPLGSTLAELEAVHNAGRRAGAPVCAMHGQRGTPLIAAAREAVRAGATGTPLVAHNQKSYRWGTRPDFYRRRSTFPGVAPWIGVHVFDWLLWILGDRFEQVSGREAASRPDYPACASQAAYLLGLSAGGVATVTLDYLRPEAAPTHGDERVRLAGPAGVVDLSTGAGSGTVIDAAGVRPLEVAPPLPWYAGFLGTAGAFRGLPQRGAVPDVLPAWEVFRATEVALKAQLAADGGRTVDLRETAYRP